MVTKNTENNRENEPRQADVQLMIQLNTTPLYSKRHRDENVTIRRCFQIYRDERGCLIQAKDATKPPRGEDAKGETLNILTSWLTIFSFADKRAPLRD